MIQRKRPRVRVDEPELAGRGGARSAPSTRDDIGRVVGGEEQRRARLAAERGELCLRRGTSRSASGPRRTRRGRGTRGPSRPTPSRAPRAPRAPPRENTRGAPEEPDRLRVREHAELGAARRARSRPRSRGRSADRACRSRSGGPPPPRPSAGTASRARRRCTRARRRRSSAPCSVEQELLVGERHLDVELRDLLDAVGAQILVPEAASRSGSSARSPQIDEQLLADLRRLREREEPRRAGAAPARGSRARPRASASP